MTVKAARAAAFSPGHVTGLFEIRDEDPDPQRRGSRGAGFSLTQGAITYVEIEPADALEIRIWLNKEEQDAPISRDALTTLLRAAVKDGKIPLNQDAPKGSKAQIRVHVHTDLHLPMRQGFGMSAAGALSAALALSKCLRMGRSEALVAAHCADVTHRGGLGDVVSASVGGFEIRTAPGIPPYGNVIGMIGFGDAVICDLGDGLDTKEILSDPTRRAAINAAGAKRIDALLTTPTLDAFLAHSYDFARDAGLLTPTMERAILASRPHGKASMSMLGNSLFAFGQTARLADALAPFGETRIVPISEGGARLVDIEAKT